MDEIELIGFDMDYTLAIYHLRQLEQLAFRHDAGQAGRASAATRTIVGSCTTTPSS